MTPATLTPAQAAADLSRLFRSRDNAGLAALAADLREQADAMPRPAGLFRRADHGAARLRALADAADAMAARRAAALPRLAPVQPTRREAARRAFHKAAGFLFPAPF